ATQVVLLRNVTQIAQDLGLRRIALRPLPLALEFGIEAVRIVEAFDVTASARVPVPIPSSTDIAGAFEDFGRKPIPPQPVQHVQPGNTGPHDEDVNVGNVRSRRRFERASHVLLCITIVDCTAMRLALLYGQSFNFIFHGSRLPASCRDSHAGAYFGRGHLAAADASYAGTGIGSGSESRFDFSQLGIGRTAHHRTRLDL